MEPEQDDEVSICAPPSDEAIHEPFPPTQEEENEVSHFLLSLCKFVPLIKKTTEVTYKPTLELGTSLLNSERALSCHLVFL
jgi:hypothetical protein